MYGPRLAGVLAAVAVGPILIGFLLLWTWTIFKRHREELRQDLEEIRTLPSNERYNPRRIFPQPLFDENIEDAVGALQIHSKSFAWHCTKKCKTSQAIPLSRLQSHLHELGDGEHRLPAERLLELIPRQVRIFVSHIVITTVIEAITISEKSHLTILHPTPVALLTEVISHGDPDGDDHKRRTISAHLRQCMAFLLPSETSNQKATDHLTDRLTNLIEDSLGFHVNDDKDYHKMLRSIFEAAINLGTCILRHPAEFRFDWAIGDPQSEKQVIVFPRVVRATDGLGLEELRPVVIGDGIVEKQK